MRNILLLFYIIVSSTTFAEDVALNAISNSTIEQVTTKYGINALLIRKSDLPIVNLNLSFRNSGYAYDAPSKQGLAYFVSQIMKEGTEKQDAISFNKELKKMGAKLNSSVDKENFIISLRVLSENFAQASELLKKSLLSLRLDDETMKRIKSKQIATLNKQMEDPNFVAEEKLMQAIYGSHPYSNCIFGTKESIEKFTKSDVQNYIKSSFNRINSVISVVGSVDREGLIEVLDQTLVDLPLAVSEVKKVSEIKINNSRKSNRQLFFEMDVPQNIIYFAKNGVGISDENYYNAVLLNYILGGSGLNSLLMSEVRGKRGLTYGIRTLLSNNKHSDLFLGFVSTGNDTALETIVTIKKVFNDTQSEGIKLKNFEEAKYNIINSFVLGLETSSQLVQLLQYIQLNNLPINYVENYLNSIEKVSLNSVNKFAQDFLNIDKLLFVEVGKHPNNTK